jgi:hypothetical protein
VRVYRAATTGTSHDANPTLVNRKPDANTFHKRENACSFFLNPTHYPNTIGNPTPPLKRFCKTTYLSVRRHAPHRHPDANEPTPPNPAKGISYGNPTCSHRFRSRPGPVEAPAASPHSIPAACLPEITTLLKTAAVHPYSSNKALSSFSLWFFAVRHTADSTDARCVPSSRRIGCSSKSISRFSH